MKKHSGFTLVEVLVAMAILSIMTLMISICYSAVSTVNIQTQGLNEKMDLMSKYAEVGELGTSGGSIEGSRVNDLGASASIVITGPSGTYTKFMTDTSLPDNYQIHEYQVLSPQDSNSGPYAIDDDGTAWTAPTTSDTVKGNYMFFTVEKMP